MNRLNKILIIPIILSFSLISLVFADNSDCWVFWSMLYSEKWSFPIVDNIRENNSNEFTKFLTIPQQQAIIRKDDLNTAIMNLKKYCCEKKLWGLSSSMDTCKKDSSYFNPNALESPYLFDHLFDVIIRRLNWLDWEKNIYTNTHMTLDKKWQERRERISEQAKSPSWSTPQVIINKFKEYWTQSPANLWYNISKKIYTLFTYRWIEGDQVFLRYVSGQWQSQESESIAEALRKYEEWTLYDRYKNSCALSEYFYSLLDMWIVSDNKRTTIHKLTSSDAPCHEKINKQIEWETAYVQLVTQKSSNLGLSNYVEWYLSYNHERQESFTALWLKIVNDWFAIVRAVPCLQHTCVK